MAATNPESVTSEPEPPIADPRVTLEMSRADSDERRGQAVSERQQIVASLRKTRHLPVRTPVAAKLTLNTTSSGVKPDIEALRTNVSKVSAYVEAVDFQPALPPFSGSSSTSKTASHSRPDAPREVNRPIIDRQITDQQVVQQASPRLASLPARQRTFVIGGEFAELPPSQDVKPFGIFVKKEEAVPQGERTPANAPQQDDFVQKIATDNGRPDSASFVIEGPAATREVIYKPLRLPEVNLDMEVDIRLKFWVLPDGTVGEVIPLQRGDIRLERAAVQYLKEWRFTPVAPGSPPVWGIMPITYKLR
jgi:TonB family protein